MSPFDGLIPAPLLLRYQDGGGVLDMLFVGRPVDSDLFRHIGIEGGTVLKEQARGKGYDMKELDLI